MSGAGKHDRLRVAGAVLAGLLLMATGGHQARAVSPSPAPSRNGGLDLGAAWSLLDTLEVCPDGPRDPAADLRIFRSLSDLAGRLDRSRSLDTCLEEELDRPARQLLRALRSSSVRYYRCPSANPALQAELLWRLILIREGPAIWRHGLEVMASHPLKPPHGMDWKKAAAEVGRPGEADLSMLADPAFVLWSSGRESYRRDKQLHQAVATVARAVPDSGAAEAADWGRRMAPTEGWLEQCILTPAEKLVEQDLRAWLDEHGALPQAVADDQGRPMPQVLPSLFLPNERAEQCGARLLCWFTGWPGFRITGYEAHGRICTLRISALDVPYQDYWGFWYQ